MFNFRMSFSELFVHFNVVKISLDANDPFNERQKYTCHIKINLYERMFVREMKIPRVDSSNYRNIRTTFINAAHFLPRKRVRL